MLLPSPAHAPLWVVFFLVPVQPGVSLGCALGLFWFLSSTYQRCNADLSSGELHLSSVGVMRVESWYLDYRHVQDLCPFASCDGSYGINKAANSKAKLGIGSL